MRFCVRLIAVALSVGATAASAREPLPRTLHYTFFVSGRPAGGSEIHVTRTNSSLVFESNTHVVVNGRPVELACRTEADPTTFEVRNFSYTGTKAGTPVASVVHVSPDSVYGTILSGGGREVPKKKSVRGREVVVFEDWVVEIQILLALRQERSTRVSTTYRIVFANSFLPGDVLVGYTGEVLLEARGRTMTARKLAVGVQGGPPFESHIDSRGVPVYLNFPGVASEIFLDEFFGDNPPTHYPPTSNPPGDSPAGGGRSND
jgi:hypothetical protein